MKTPADWHPRCVGRIAPQTEEFLVHKTSDRWVPHRRQPKTNDRALAFSTGQNEAALTHKLMGKWTQKP
jgi:hypothetical protein